MKRRLRFTGSLILLFFASNLFGQTDSTRNHFSIDATIDYGKLATLFIDSQTKYEGELGLTYARYRITAEYGVSELNSDELFDNAEVKAEGNYYRLGFDFYISLNPKNNLFLGARYASSDFDESIMVNYNSNVYSSFIEESTGLSAVWYEVVVSSETKLLGPLFLGFKARLRILDNYDNPGLIDIIEIPGYGKTYDKSLLAINFYLRYRLNFR